MPTLDKTHGPADLAEALRLPLCYLVFCVFLSPVVLPPISFVARAPVYDETSFELFLVTARYIW